MSSYHTDCHICGRKKWHDAIQGQEIRTYCPTCDPPKKRTSHDDVPPQPQMLGDGSGQLRTVENKVRLPETGTVGAMMIVLDEGAVYCYISPDVGWMAVGTQEQAAEAVDAPATKVKKSKDKRNNRRAAIEATKRKIAERKKKNPYMT